MQRIQFWIETTFGSAPFGLMFVVSFGIVVWSMF